jgi:hypothetical protein
MIVDAEKGLAVISRSVIPFDLGVLSLTFAESIIIPGKVTLDVVSLILGGVFASHFRCWIYFMGSQTPWRYANSICSTSDRLHPARYGSLVPL